LSGQIFWQVFECSLIVLSGSSNQWSNEILRKLENLAILQRLELLLKFAAKTEENSVLCFQASWKGSKEASSPSGTQ
jgi:hypothetical protein